MLTLSRAILGLAFTFGGIILGLWHVVAMKPGAAVFWMLLLAGIGAIIMPDIPGDEE